MNLLRVAPISRLAAIVASVTLLAGCATGATGAHWADPGVHAVDGYWVGDEHWCVSDVWCAAEIAFAESELGIDPANVVRATTATPLSQWVTASGEPQYPVIFGGLTKPAFVLLTLRDGSRRARVVICSFTDPNRPVPTVCRQADNDIWRVGEQVNGPPT